MDRNTPKHASWMLGWTCSALLLVSATTSNAQSGHGADDPDVRQYGTPGIVLNSSKTSILYDDFEKPGGYTLADYATKWSNPFGLGDMAINDTRNFAGGALHVDAVPFQTGFDFSVFDHLKYIAISNQVFVMPERGSITFSAEITAETPGTQPGRVIEGMYIQSGDPYAEPTLEGQQAGVVLNMIDFGTGQLFDWFVSGHKAFTLIERLPSSVTGSPNFVGRDLMYTQIIDEITITPGKHRVEIQYTRDAHHDKVEYFFDGRKVSSVKDVGIPLDVQNRKYTGISPSLGPGERLRNKISAFAIGHGLFSLLDAFPYQHEDSPELAVSIPVSNRLFGQGARGEFDNFEVTTVALTNNGLHGNAVPEPVEGGAEIARDSEAAISGRVPAIEASLRPVTPNPVRGGAARVGFAVAHESRVRLSVVDLQGRVVAVLADRVFEPGTYQSSWNGMGHGSAASAGVYFVRYQTEGRTFTQRFALVR
jgi:hypothetical protein